MRKRNCMFLADTIFWYLIYFLPCICYFISFINGQVLDFATFFSSIGFGFVSDNIVITALTSIFGASGVLPLFNTTAPFIIFSWFICTYLAHLAVDFLLFIPRLCHKFMDKFTKGDME